MLNSSTKQQFWIYVTITLLYSVLFIIIKDDPFYGDSKSTISRLSTLIYDTDFNIWLYPQGMDPGHPTLIPNLHALLWKVFGQELWVSHLINALFTLFALLGFFNLDTHFETKGRIGILMAANPIFLSMFAGLNTHIILLALLTWYIWFHFKSFFYLQLFSLALLPLIHNQGFLIVASIIIANLLMQKNYKRSLLLLLAFIPWIIWLYLHKHYTGWYLFPPEYSEFRGIGSPLTLVKNALLMIWRLLDFGVFVVIGIALWNYKLWDKKSIYLVILALGIATATWLSVKFSIAHRYYIFSAFLLTIIAAQFLKNLKVWKQLIVVFLLLSGSFWYYPGKQLADANLQYRHYYQVYQQIQESPIANLNTTIFSTPPNESSLYVTHLSKDSSLLNIAAISNVNDSAKVKLIMQGNTNGPLPKHWQQEIDQWPFKRFRSGPAWVQVHIHPELAPHFPTDYFSGPRNPSWMESLIIKLKASYK